MCDKKRIVQPTARISHRSPARFRIRRLLAALLLLVALLPYAPALQAQSSLPGPEERHPDRLLIGLQPNTDPATLEAQLAPYGLLVERIWPDLNLAAVRPAIQAASLADAVQASAATYHQLHSAGLFRFVDVDGVVHIAATPNDPLLDSQWAIAATNALAAREIIGGNRRIVIAILDTGVSFTHEDFDSTRFWTNPGEQDGLPGVDDDGNGYVDDIRGWDWVARNNDPTDEHGHGTHVAGIITALTDNGIGIAGTGGDITIAPLRILDRFGSGYISDLIAALDYARTQRFPIVNLSLTVSSNFPALHDAVKALHASGALIVTATGNFGGPVAFPAAYPETLAVAATNSAGQRANFSNYGLTVDLAAPGDNVLSTHLNNGYRVLSGTSMSVPHVSALAGLIWSLRPDLTREEVVDLMRTTAADLNAATHPGQDIYLGAGQIDFAAALGRAAEGLDLRLDESVGALAATDVSFSTTLQVYTPSGDVQSSSVPHPAIPIGGAVVRYSVLDLRGEQINTVEKAITDANGIARISFSVPAHECPTQVWLRLGDKLVPFDLSVYANSVVIHVETDSLSVQAGDSSVAFTVTLEDPHLVLAGNDLTFQLFVESGSFANHSDSMTVPVGIERSYSGQFVADSAAGEATITACFGFVSGSATVQIRPGPAASVQSASTAGLFQVRQDRAELEFLVYDAFGNLVEDGTLVGFSAPYGSITPNPVPTVGGKASAVLTVPDAWQWHYHHFSVRAWAVDGNAETEAPISLPRSHLPTIILR